MVWSDLSESIGSWSDFTVWILASGIWNDFGVWDDAALWRDSNVWSNIAATSEDWT